MKNLFFAIIGIFIVCAPVLAVDWTEEKGIHFIVYYKESDEEKEEEKLLPREFVKSVLRKAEKCYKSSARELGYQKLSKFWTWDNRVKIYIYPSHEDYVTSTGHPKWTKGYAVYEKKEIIGCRDNDREFLEGILPHEIGHLMFRDFIGFKSDVPLWLDEGVAQWQEKVKRKIARGGAKVLLARGKALTIESLVSIKDSEVLKEKIRTKEEIEKFYLQSVSLIDFLVSRYGKARFTAFCRDLRDGKTVEEALGSSYPSSISTLEGLGKQWEEYAGED
jgi:hypothetical protein